MSIPSPSPPTHSSPSQALCKEAAALAVSRIFNTLDAREQLRQSASTGPTTAPSDAREQLQRSESRGPNDALSDGLQANPSEVFAPKSGAAAATTHVSDDAAAAASTRCEPRCGPAHDLRWCGTWCTARRLLNPCAHTCFSPVAALAADLWIWQSSQACSLPWKILMWRSARCSQACDGRASVLNQT
eukprot:365574-Chlamydomonas_euryale.AAC.13